VKYLLVLSLLIVSACSTFSPSMKDHYNSTVSQIKKQGTVLKRYKKSNSTDEIFVVKDSQEKIWKLRLYPMQAGNSMGQFKGYLYQALYSVDQNIEQCFSGPSQSPIECSKLKKDKDLAPYIK
jgi:hypothetical protein